MKLFSLVLSVIALTASGSAEARETYQGLSPAEVLQKLEGEITQKIAANKIKLPAYFLVPMGYEGPGNKAFDSHTFASFVAVTGNGKMDWSDTISWLPDDYVGNEKIGIFMNAGELIVDGVGGTRHPAVKGKNYHLAMTTLGWWYSPKDPKRGRRTLGVWGPYHVKESFYRLGLKRISDLREAAKSPNKAPGRLGYLADDRNTRNPPASRQAHFQDSAFGSTAVNCMHAVADLPGFYDEQKYGFKDWGIQGTVKVMRHYARNGNGNLWFYEDVKPTEYREVLGK